METGLALLNHASVPLRYWDFAFETAVYAMNRVVTSLLPNCSPFEKLFKKKPNLHELRTFGCVCYPLLRPYNKHKLENRSVLCLFVGYSAIHKGYKCLDVTSNRLYISRDVVFDEQQFYFPKVQEQQVLIKSKFTPPLNSDSGILGPPPAPLDRTNRIFPSATGVATSTIHSHIPASAVTDNSGSVTTPNIGLIDNSGSGQDCVPAASVVPLAVDSSVATEHTVLPAIEAPSQPVSSNAHPMLTRSKTGHSKPKVLVSVLPPRQPKSVTEAKQFREWREAMESELNSLLQLGTWELTELPKDANVVGCKWVFRVKENADGSIARYKARLVAKGFHQRPGEDYAETFSPVVKPTTIRTVLSIAVSNKWTVTQYDVSNAFLHGKLNETVYMMQPPGYVDASQPNSVCRLHRSLYGLKQAPRQWNHCLRDALKDCGFYQSKLDHSLFILKQGSSVLYCLVYVDDLLLTGNDSGLLQNVEKRLQAKFLLNSLGPLHYFLGIQATWQHGNLFLFQTKYIKDLLHRVKMTEAKQVSTPATVSKIEATSATTALSDITLYRSTIGSLQYLSFTRPEIAFSVNRLAQFMHSPSELNWQEVKRILRYLKGTSDYGLILRPTTLNQLHAYSDADWAGSVEDRKSTTGYAIYLGRNLISWSSRKQKSVSRSSTEAEYRAIANTTSEILWIRNLLHELGLSVQTPSLWCDNMGATSLTVNPVHHSRMKHVQIDVHFVRDRVANKELQVRYLSTKDQIADILTKPLAKGRFLLLRDKLTIVPHR